MFFVVVVGLSKNLPDKLSGFTKLLLKILLRRSLGRENSLSFRHRKVYNILCARAFAYKQREREREREKERER